MRDREDSRRRYFSVDEMRIQLLQKQVLERKDLNQSESFDISFELQQLMKKDISGVDFIDICKVGDSSSLKFDEEVFVVVFEQ